MPWIANFLQNQVDIALGAAGTSAAAVGVDTLRGAGLYYGGMAILGAGPILVGMILAAIAAYMIDRKWLSALGYALFGAVASFFGVIHASELGIAQAVEPTIGYLAIASWRGSCTSCGAVSRASSGATDAIVADEERPRHAQERTAGTR